MARRRVKVTFVGDEEIHQFAISEVKTNDMSPLSVHQQITEVKRSRQRVKVTFVADDEIHEFVKSTVQTKGIRKQPKVKAAVDDDESSLSEEDAELANIKPIVYSDDDDGIYGQDVFTFSKTSRKSGAMAKKAEEVVELETAKPTLTLQSTTKLDSETIERALRKRNGISESRCADKNNNGTSLTTRCKKKIENTTPYRLRSRNEAADSSDDSASSSDEDETDGEEEEVVEEEDEEKDEDDGSAKIDVNKESVTEKNNGSRSLKEMAEDYFYMASDKYVTSDRTLAKLNTPRMDAKSLIQIVNNLSSLYKKERIRLYKRYTTYFRKWMFQLCNGRNILLHGLGSKRPLLELFRTRMLGDHNHLVVNGFFPSLTLRHVLTSIVEDILDHEDVPQSVNDLQERIMKHYQNTPDQHLFLIVNNIDGVLLRSEKVQNALSHLAELENVHVIASIDHINAPLIWDQAKCSRFQWIWYDCTTYEPYSDETSYENSLLVQQSGVLALSSLRHVMGSLTPNAKQIFYLLAEHQLDQSGNSNYIGLSFPDLYQKCREAFLVNSNLTLKAQLTEFRDHKLIKSKKGPDGTEHLSIPLDDATLKEFMENKDEH